MQSPLQPPTPSHVWYTPADIAARLDARKFGAGWRAKCPVHDGDNRSTLSINEGTDKYGHPNTLLYCHAYQCSIQDICEALSIPIAGLSCIQMSYARATRNAPRQGGPRIAKLRLSLVPANTDDLAELMLAEMIVSDATFLANCPPARETFWRLVQDPARKPGLVKALIEAAFPVRATLDALREEWGTVHEPGNTA